MDDQVRMTIRKNPKVMDGAIRFDFSMEIQTGCIIVPALDHRGPVPPDNQKHWVQRVLQDMVRAEFEAAWQRYEAENPS